MHFEYEALSGYLFKKLAITELEPELSKVLTLGGALTQAVSSFLDNRSIIQTTK